MEKVYFWVKCQYRDNESVKKCKVNIVNVISDEKEANKDEVADDDEDDKPKKVNTKGEYV